MRVANIKKRQLRKNKLALALGAVGFVFSTQHFAIAAEADQADQIEEVVVSGVRASLEAALDIKRNSASIVDAISSEDIDSLPARDFGEALAALPGIQLNEEDEGGQSTISLRGLDAGFTKTTVMGQSWASPAPAGGNLAANNTPFAAFEAGVFDGVTVIKSPTADLQEGGMAGTVDQRLQRALSKKDGRFNVSVGGAYDDLSREFNPSFKAAGVKHLIDDTLAVAFKYAQSKQGFRRDQFQVVDYSNAATTATNLADYRAAWGIPDGDRIEVAKRARNETTYNEGDRQSFTGNIEFKPMDELTLGAHILYSQRDLNNGSKEQAEYRINDSANNKSAVTLDLETAPFTYKDLEPVEGQTDVGQVWVAPAYSFDNGEYQFGSRKTTFNEETGGAVLYAEFERDSWAFDSKITHSEATNKFTNTGYDYRHQNLKAAPSTISGYINTGGGDLDEIEVSGMAAVPYVYSGLTFATPNVSSSTVASTDVKNQKRQLIFALTGRIREITREENSFEFNAARELDLGVTAFSLNKVKFGGRVSSEQLDSDDFSTSAAGIDPSNINGSYIDDNPYSRSQAPFFGGNLTGSFDYYGGWNSFDDELTRATLQSNIVTDRDLLTRPKTIPAIYPNLQRTDIGFWDRMDPGTDLPALIALNFESEQDISAAYITTDFGGELPLDMSYRGNAGVRYVQTENLVSGLQIGRNDDGEPIATPTTFKGDYKHTLPMMNLAVNVRDDLVLRTAAYKSLVRPNMLNVGPSANIDSGNTTIKLTLPGTDVKPFEADNIDLSLEWYNRGGSAITLGVFQKNIVNFFEQLDGYCPIDGSDPLVNQLLGPLQLGDNTGVDGEGDDDELTRCQRATPSQVLDEDGVPTGEFINRPVVIKKTANGEDEIKITGYEFSVQQNLDFLPHPWNGLGGVFNYTEIDQSGADITLSRISPKSYNVVTYWEDDALSLRFTYRWRDTQSLQGANANLGTNPRFTDSTARLDFKGSYNFGKGLRINLQVNNLLDDTRTQYYGDNEEAIHSIIYDGRTYSMSLNYNF